MSTKLRSSKLRPSNASTAAPYTIVTGASGHEYHGHWGNQYKKWTTEVSLGGAEAKIKVDDQVKDYYDNQKEYFNSYWEKGLSPHGEKLSRLTGQGELDVLVADENFAAEKVLLESVTGLESEAEVTAVSTQIFSRITRVLEEEEGKRRYEQEEGPYADDPDRDERNTNWGCVAARSYT